MLSNTGQCDIEVGFQYAASVCKFCNINAENPELCFLIERFGIRIASPVHMKAVPLFSPKYKRWTGLPSAVIQYLLAIGGVQNNPSPKRTKCDVGCAPETSKRGMNGIVHNKQ